MFITLLQDTPIITSFSNGFIQWLLERTDVARVWKEHTHHSFVAGLANGTLPVDRFKYYLIQDYLYLVQFARATALAAYKAKSIDDIAAVRCPQYFERDR